MKYIAFLFGIVIGTSIYFGIIGLADYSNSLCIPNTPHEMNGGLIHDINYYYLNYVGTQKDSGEVCEIKIRVTPMEYDRQMYGNTK